MELRVFFGGSFMPPHIGHHELLERLLRESGVSHVHLVPTGINPLKDHPPLFSSAERRQLINAWVHTVKQRSPEISSKLKLETFELDSEKVSYTVQSLRTLKERNPESRWVVAIGADLLEQLPRWRAVNDLLSGLEAVWVFKRGGYALSPQEIPESLRGLCAWRLFPESLQWISSTELRDLGGNSDALQARLKPYLLDNVFEVFARLLLQKNRE
ncbi:MAG TPA: nicotinate-nicotinamide nucleotide adenylyltransferase [Bdellovibrionota bacterium]|nr:nicotinate-nicotinamide nucleotide adenylyltransferase [Bdellovibrionota bacterium]